MDTMGKTVRGIAIWVTAIMTLIAGTPHFVCRCPNGNVKPFCFAVPIGTTGCCCGGACCSSGGSSCCCAKNGSTIGSTDERGGACGEKSRDVVNTADVSLQASSKTCTKTVAQLQDQTASSARTTSDQDCAPGAFLHTQLQSVSMFSAEVPYRIGWHLQLVPPPTDLVITFQHFLI